jgi:RHS repeat-associated protein
VGGGSGDGVSSAVPQHLADGAKVADEVTGRLAEEVARRRVAYDRFMASDSESGISSGPMESALPAFLGEQQATAAFIEVVREALVSADRFAAGPSGVVSVSDDVLAAGFDEAARRHGIDPALLSQVRPLPVAPVIAGAIPRNSGFVIDPVCTATGHLVEGEVDVAVPARLEVLNGARWYSSRLVDEVGAFGRGWSSWPSVHCLVTGGVVGLAGPDGRRMRAVPDSDGWCEFGDRALLLAGPNGSIELRWAPDATFGSQRWRFEADGRLQSVWASALGTASFTYDGDRLIRIEHDGGRKLTYEWSHDAEDGSGRIVGLAMSDGRRVDYSYNEQGDLVAVAGAVAPRTYEPDDRGRIVSVVDADGIRLCQNRYDVEGRVVSQVTASGHEIGFRYRDRTTVVVDGGVETRYDHDSRGRVVGFTGPSGASFTQTYDDRGRVVSQTGLDGRALTRLSRVGEDGEEIAELVAADNGGEQWSTDALGRVRWHERADGRRLAFEYEDDAELPVHIEGPDGWRIAYRWADGLLVEVTDADGVAVAVDYDSDGCPVASRNALGAETGFEHHRSGRPGKVRYPDGEESRLKWDDAGRLLALVDSSGAETRFEYSPAGRLLSVTDPEGGRTTMVYGADGEVVAVVDPLGRSVTLSRDALSRIGGIVNPDGSKWELSYSQAGLVSMLTGPDGSVWSAAYDTGMRVAELVDPTGGTVTRGFDEAGRLATVADPTGAARGFRYDDAGRLAETTDPLGAVTRLAWDALDRLAMVTDPDGVTETRTYTPSGRLSSVADGAGATTRFAYDDAGRLVAAIDPAGGMTSHRYDERDRVIETRSPAGRVRSLTYDAAGRVASVTRGGATWRYRYDRCGRVVSATDPLGAVTRSTYDVAGRVTAVTDPRGERVEFRYDAMDRVVETVDPCGRSVKATYDVMGRRTAVTDQLGRTTTFGWSRSGRMMSVGTPVGDELGYERDVRGALIRLLINGTPSYRYERDATGRLRVVDEIDGGRITRTHQLDWSPAGRLTAFGNGDTNLSWTHDAAGRVSTREGGGPRLDYRFGTNGRLTGLWSQQWGEVTIERDPDGLLTGLRADGLSRTWDRGPLGLITGYRSTVGHGPARAVTIGRDAAGRVIQIDEGGVVIRYGHDVGGQLTSIAGRGRSARFTYDAAGRLTGESGPRGNRQLTYDDAHQLVAITGPDGVRRYRYDANGRRIDESGAGPDCSFHWDALGRLRRIERNGHDDDHPVTQLDVDAFGHLVRVDDHHLTWDPTGPVPQPTTIDDRWVLTVLGQRLAIAPSQPEFVPDPLDADWRGSVAPRDEWGRPNGEPPDPTVLAPGVALGFAGELEVGVLLWLRHRTFDPASASFLSRDPVPGSAGTAAAANPYRYGGNDPLDWIDPLGLHQAVPLDTYEQFRRDAQDVQWGTLAKVGLLIGGVALTIAFPAAGPLALGLLGAGLGAAPAVIDGVTTGHWDAGAIVKGAVVGGATGVVSAYIPGAGALAGAGASATTKLGLSVGLGAATGTGGALLNESYDLTPLPGSDHTFDVANIATGTLLGGAGGATGYYAEGPLNNAATQIRAWVSGPPSTTTVFRFHDANDALSLQSRLASADPAVQARVRSNLSSPESVQQAATFHMQGYVQDSPFVSVTTNPGAAAASTDPWLRTIATGRPGQPGVRPAPHLSEFDVPTARLVSPEADNALSLSEEELLWHGDDLADFLVATKPNPYLG